jgi:hypothetical protein
MLIPPASKGHEAYYHTAAEAGEPSWRACPQAAAILQLTHLVADTATHPPYPYFYLFLPLYLST